MAEWNTRWIQVPVGKSREGSSPSFRTKWMMEDIVFYCKVIEKGTKDNKKFVLLDNTLFYPDGKGGQLGDRGEIGGKRVNFVYEENNRIIHFIEDFPENIEVKARIDGKRRLDISIQHTSQHILSRVILNLFKKETVSFHMGEEISTLDIEYFDLKKDDIKRIEEESNKIVSSGKKVNIYFIDEEDIESLSLRKTVNLNGKIRVVDIEDFDKTMCGGTHVKNTIEIKLIKVVKFEKIKGNLIRIYYLSGDRAISNYNLISETIDSLKNRYSVGLNEIENFIDNLIYERDLLRKNLKGLKIEFIEKIIEENREKPLFICYLPYLESEDLIYLSKKLLSNKTNFVFVYNDEVGIINKNELVDIDLFKILNEIKENFKLKGGGKDYITLKVDKKGKEIENYLWQKIK